MLMNSNQAWISDAEQRSRDLLLVASRSEKTSPRLWQDERGVERANKRWNMVGAECKKPAR